MDRERMYKIIDKEYEFLKDTDIGRKKAKLMNKIIDFMGVNNISLRYLTNHIRDKKIVGVGED